MTAKDYPVTFGYLAWWGSYQHRGEDRAMPTGTPIVVNGTTIGLSGNTGKSSGPHLHLQVGKDPWAQQTVKPTNHWFKGTEVVTTGTASEWGNYVIVKNGAYYCVYAHLSKVNVKKGDKLSMAYKDIDKGYAKYKEDIKRIFGNIPAYFNYKNGWPKYQSWDRWKLNNQIARTQRRGRVNAEATIEVLKADLAKANKALTSLSTRPTKDELERVRAEAEKRVQQALSACEAHESEREVVENVLKRAWNKVIKWFFSKE